MLYIIQRDILHILNKYSCALSHKTHYNWFVLENQTRELKVVSVILLPLRKLRSIRITDLYPHFRSEIVILHSVSLHSGPQTLDAPGLIGIRSAHDS